ncbi:MAG TPA: sugar ABC transporter permease [Mycobacterium sp.]|nr:sugar ABC transporter permease [Mycobacterium sp.]
MTQVSAPTKRAEARRGRIPGGPYLLLLPAAVAMAGVSIYPLFYGVRASITHYLYGREFGRNGLTNYRNVFHDQFFWEAMRTTAKYVICAVTVETLLGLGLALLVSREIRFGGPIRVGLILPMTIAPVVVGVMWRLLYDSGIGVTDTIWGWFGAAPPNVLAHNTSAFIAVVVVDVWEWTPLIFLILLAGLQSLPQEPLEAARVDGAGRVRLFFDHTLPMLAPVLLVAITLRTIDAIGTFDQIYVLTQGGPGTSTRLISIYAYNTAFLDSQYGQAAAMLLSLLAMVTILMVAAVRMLRKSAA